MKAHIYIEGAESKEDKVRCREAFAKLFVQAGLANKMPRLSACGGRNSAFDDFQTAHAKRQPGDYIGLLVDSEDPTADIDLTWSHLQQRDGWECPEGAEDQNILLMTTCMETWIVADREALRQHYGHKLQEKALPTLHCLEDRNRHEVHDKLVHATRLCSKTFAKGKRSFEALGVVTVSALQSLPSFVRVINILKQRL